MKLSDTNNQVILVDEDDSQIGVMDKLEAHQKGLLHRAYSVFIFNKKNELLIQRRTYDKYHSGGLWTNTCCSHPQPGEYLNESVKKRLQEEMGITCDLSFAFRFIYRSQLDNGLSEHELDHVFFGQYSNDPIPNPVEVSDWKYKSFHSLTEEIQLNPEKFTSWFKICLPQMQEYLENKK